MINVIHIVTRINMGGITTFLYNYYKYMDRSRINFEIVSIDTRERQSHHDKFEELGAKVHYMPQNLFERFTFLLRLMKSKKYDIAHSHIELQSAIYLTLAKMSGIKIRIAHAHLSRANNGIKNSIFKYILNKVVSIRAGASDLAMEAVFGKKHAEKGIVFWNAVALEEFDFDEEARNEYRDELGLDEKLVVGFVGRLTYQKNIRYLVQIFDSLAKKRKEVRLLIVGDGEDSEILTTELKARSLADKLIWLKTRKDVNRLLNAMDVLVLPSHFEGLPLVLVESQANSLHAIVSDKVTRLVNLTSYIHYLPIDSHSVEKWRDMILALGSDYPRVSTEKVLTEKHFNISVEANNLTELYTQLVANT